jgi:cellulose synthase/poly-beta-1,6-N-acetylglucosamine synthase-like glycosyltransferase
VSPKKHAVMQGIKKARNPTIVFTDADCRVKASWLETIDGHFTPRTGLVQGMTAYACEEGRDGAFFGIQALDFLSHGIVAASAIGRNFPLNSNANNFAFRKEAFDDAGGYGGSGGVVSGDDDLLLQRVWKSGKWDVRYMSDPAGAVETFPAPTFSRMFEQRKRWGSKTVHYNAGQVAFLGGIFCFYLMILLCCLAAIFCPALWVAAGAMLLVKLLGESVLLLPGTRLFDKKELRRFIVPASLLQLPMVVGAVLMGVFGRFGWKGQTFGRRMKRVR